MPYAKVGALPQPTDVGRMEQHQQRGKGRGKQKAMSMQDLKKQTALRLAQEQSLAQEETENSSLKAIKQPLSRVPPPSVTHIVQSVRPSQLLFYTNRGGNVNESGLHMPFNNNQVDPRSTASEFSSVYHHGASSCQHQKQHQQPEKEQPGQPSSIPMHSHSSLQHQRRHLQSNNWFTDIRSETSSVRSYEYDCNASIASNAEVASLASGGSSHYQQRLHQFYTEPFSAPVAPIRSLQVTAARDDQVSPLPQASLNSSIESKTNNRVAVNSPICNNMISEDEGWFHQGAHVMFPKQRKPPPNKASIKEHQDENQNWKAKTGAIDNSYRTHHQSQQHQVTPQHKKLPHGLTVSELKEMTRARLASEAANENPTEQQLLFLMRQQEQCSRDGTDVSGSITEINDFQQRSYHRTHSCEELTFIKPACSMEVSAELPVTPKHQQVFRHIHSPSHTNGLKSQNFPTNNPNSLQKHLTPVSYMSPVKQGTNSQASSQLSMHYRQNDNKASQYELLRQQYLDTLESTSVASINSSTFGSESMHSMSFPMKQQPPTPNPNHNEIEPSFFSRSWSQPAGASFGSTFEPSEPNDTPKSMSSFFEVPVGLGNIVGSGRSLLGLSPPGFHHLEVAHEDRPLHLADDVTVSLFDTPRSSKWSAATRGENILSISTTPVHQSQVTTQKLFPDDNPFPKYDACHDLILPPIVSENARNASTGTSMSGSICNWVAESVLRNTNHQSSVNHDKVLSSVNTDLPVASFSSNSTLHLGYDSINNDTISTSLASNSSTLTYSYDQVHGSSSVFRSPNVPKDSKVNTLSSTSSVSDSPFVKARSSTKDKDTCNSWCDNLIGLTNHLGSLLPFVAEEKGNGNSAVEEQRSSFVSRIDPEFELVRPSPPIVHSPSIDVMNSPTSGYDQKVPFLKSASPVIEQPGAFHNFGTPKESDNCAQEDVVSTPNLVAKTSTSSRSHKRRSRGPKKNIDNDWKRREKNNTSS